MCALIADRAANAAGLREALYPATGLPPKYPGMVAIMGETTIEYFSTEQRWIMQVRGLLMTGLTTDTKRNVNEVDPLIVKIVDAFAAAPDPFVLVDPDDADNRTDMCLLSTVLGGQAIDYAGAQHYGAELRWTVDFRRFNP